MSSTKKRLQLAGALAALATLALAVSCTGFFPKATLQSVAIQPQSPQILLNTPNQTALQVWGTDTDNNRSQITTGVSWSTNPTGVVSIDPKTFVPNGLSLTTTTLTANVQGLSTTATATVTVGCIQSIAVTPSNPGPISAATSQTIPFVATAATCNGAVVITDVAAWSSSNTAAATIDSSGVATAVAVGTTNITATSDGVTSNVVVVTVNP
jgi:Bacterial Ig-like domain (group 2)